MSAPGFVTGLTLNLINLKAYAVHTFLFGGFTLYPDNFLIEVGYKQIVLNFIWICDLFIWLYAGLKINQLNLTTRKHNQINLSMAISIIAVVLISIWSVFSQWTDLVRRHQDQLLYNNIVQQCLCSGFVFGWAFNRTNIVGQLVQGYVSNNRMLTALKIIDHSQKRIKHTDAAVFFNNTTEQSSVDWCSHISAFMRTTWANRIRCMSRQSSRFRKRFANPYGMFSLWCEGYALPCRHIFYCTRKSCSRRGCAVLIRPIFTEISVNAIRDWW